MSGSFQAGDEVQVYSTDGTYFIYQYNPTTGWMAGRRPASEVPLTAGDSFWLKTPNRSVDVVFKGVVKKGDYRYQASVGAQMISADFPVAFTVNDTEDRVSWENAQTGDQLQVLSTDGTYKIYTYSSASGKWLEGRVPTDAQIPVGSSLWLNSQSGDLVLRVKNPIQ